MTAITMTLPVFLPSGHGEAPVVYDTAEPFVVRFGLWDARMWREVVWRISRELLAEAVNAGQAGIGQVRVTVRGDLLVLGLSNQDGSCAVVFRRDDIVELLCRTNELVRPGTEGDLLDWSDLPGVSQ